MNNKMIVEEARREISLAYNHAIDGVALTNMGRVAIWVLKDAVLYLDNMLEYGNWRLSGLAEPAPEVRVLASHYGVTI